MSDVQNPNPDVLGQIGTGLASAGNSLAFGAPELLTNTFGGKDAWKNFLAKNDQATGLFGLKPSEIGGGAGLLGSMFIPGGFLAKGASLAAKGLGAGEAATKLAKAGEFLGGAGGKTLGNNILRGGGQAVEQAIPRALIGGANSVLTGQQDPGSAISQGIGDVGTSALAGGVLGGALGFLPAAGKRIFGNPETGAGGMAPEQLSQHLKESSADQAVAGILGTTTRGLRQIVNEGANYEKGNIGKARTAERAIQDQAQVLHDYKIGNLSDLDDLHDQVKQFYDSLSGRLDSTNTPIPKIGDTTFQDWVKQDPSWASFSRLHPDADEILDSYTQKLADPASPGSIMKNPGQDPAFDPARNLYNVTGDDAGALRFGQTGDAQSIAHVADLIHTKLADHVLDLASKESKDLPYPPGMSSVEDVNKFYHDNAVYRATKRQEATTMQQASMPGSDTALKLGIGGALGGILPGAAIGAGVGSQGDISNIPGMAAGAIVGGMANRGLSALTNKLGGHLGLGLNQALGGSAADAMATPLGQRLQALRDFARGGAMAPGALPQVTPVPLPQVSLPAGIGASMGMPMGAGAPPMPPQGQAQPAQGPMPQAPQGASSGMMQAPGAMPPQPQATQVLQNMGTYGKVVMGKIMQMYNQMERSGHALSANGIDPNTFANGIMNASTVDGKPFSPNLMANVLFPDEAERKAFLTSFQTVQQLQGLNVDSVLGLNPLVGGIGGSVLNGQYAATRGQIASVLAQSGKESDVRSAMNQIDSIQWMNVPVQQKRMILAKLIQKNANINTSMIHQYGLDQGTVLEALPQ